MELLLFIPCFFIVHHLTRDLVSNTKVYAIRMLLFCLTFYVLYTQLELLA